MSVVDKTPCSRSLKVMRERVNQAFLVDRPCTRCLVLCFGGRAYQYGDITLPVPLSTTEAPSFHLPSPVAQTVAAPVACRFCPTIQTRRIMTKEVPSIIHIPTLFRRIQRAATPKDIESESRSDNIFGTFSSSLALSSTLPRPLRQSPLHRGQYSGMTMLHAGSSR